MAHSAAGKSDRKGITVIELGDMFPDEEAARAWFERKIWPDGRHCPHCGSVRTHEASHANSPYRCTDCRGYFSVKTNTIMHKSQLPLRKCGLPPFYVPVPMLVLARFLGRADPAVAHQ